MKNILFILLLVVFNSLTAQKNIKDSEGNIISYIKENIVLDSNHQVLFNYQGFIVFKELSSHRNDIVLTLDVRKNKTKIYNKVDKIPSWIIRNNSIIWKKDREEFDVINIQKQNGFTSFYNAYNDSLIAYVDSEEITDIELSLAFFQIWNVLDLKKKFTKEKDVYTRNGDLPEGILGSMKPVFGDDLNVWYWDGKYLFPAFNNDPRYVWIFDGETIKPNWNSRMENEWSWDGEEISPFWGGHPRNNWRWEGNIFRQVFENNYKNEYEITDNIVRKRFGSYGDNEWEIEGEIPLAMISIVLLKIAYR